MPYLGNLGNPFLLPPMQMSGGYGGMPNFNPLGNLRQDLANMQAKIWAQDYPKLYQCLNPPKEKAPLTFKQRLEQEIKEWCGGILDR